MKVKSLQTNAKYVLKLRALNLVWSMFMKDKQEGSTCNYEVVNSYEVACPKIEIS